jgi:hypothetical protein
LSKV